MNRTERAIRMGAIAHVTKLRRAREACRPHQVGRQTGRFRLPIVGDGNRPASDGLHRDGGAQRGRVRVGLKESCMPARGRLATSNAEPVGQPRGIQEVLSTEIATPAQARALLGVKGAASVAFR